MAAPSEQEPTIIVTSDHFERCKNCSSADEWADKVAELTLAKSVTTSCRPDRGGRAMAVIHGEVMIPLAGGGEGYRTETATGDIYCPGIAEERLAE
jgi:hypothetical protein